MSKPKEVAIADLVLDHSLYPRAQVSSVTVSQLADAIQAGSVLPPIRVDRETMRVIDGFHRVKAHKHLGLETIAAQLEIVVSDADFFERAVAANSAHGSRFAPYDYARILQRAMELGLERERVAVVLRATPVRLEEVERGYFALMGSQPVPTKRTIAHMCGRQLTPAQVETNKKLGGMNQFFYVNQLLLLIDNDLIDWDNPKLLEGLYRLAQRLGDVLPVMGEELKEAA